MSALPYFRWYPADALGDQKYSAMSDMELGFYHRCLNLAWLNGGLPQDMGELAATMHVTRKYLDKLWPKVGRCFQLNDCVHPKFVNTRQEKERAHAIEKSSKASSSVAQRKDRTNNDGYTNVGTNDALRGRAGADSVCGSVVDFKKGESRGENNAARREGAMAISDRFPEWLDGFRGRKGHPDRAGRIWVSRVSTDSEAQAAFAARDRYNASDEVARGVLTEAAKFLQDQADNGWAGEWPRAADRQPDRHQQKNQEVLGVLNMLKEVRNG